MPSKRSSVHAAPMPVKASSPRAPTKRRYVIPRKRPWWYLHAVALGVGISLSAHGLLMALNFKLPEINVKRQQDHGLDIVLVNAKHAHAPQKAQALAQANLDGGGTVDEKVRATSPLPPQDANEAGDALVEANRRVKQMESKQRELMTQAKSMASVAIDHNAPKLDQPLDQPSDIAGLDLEKEKRLIARQEAIVERQLQEYSQRPRKTFIGSRTQEYRFAQYVEDWRHKIQRVGTLNYPATKAGRLYGSLLVSIEINSDGKVVSAEIKRSSGNKKLDDAALRIIHLAEPFAAFPPNIRKDTDILVISRTWTFVNDTVATE